MKRIIQDKLKEEASKVVITGLSHPDLAFSMWRDLLLEYSDYLTDGDYIRFLIENVLRSFCRTDYPREKGIFERVIPCFNKYPEIVEIIYGKAGMACYLGYAFYSSICLACCIVSNQAEMTYTIIKHLSENQNINVIKGARYWGMNHSILEFTAGKFLLKTYEKVNSLIGSDNEQRYEITENVKEALCDSLYFFKDPYIRAECAIPIMAMIGYDFKKD